MWVAVSIVELTRKSLLLGRYFDQVCVLSEHVRMCGVSVCVYKKCIFCRLNTVN